MTYLCPPIGQLSLIVCGNGYNALFWFSTDNYRQVCREKRGYINVMEACGLSWILDGLYISLSRRGGSIYKLGREHITSIYTIKWNLQSPNHSLLNSRLSPKK